MKRTFALLAAVGTAASFSLIAQPAMAIPEPDPITTAVEVTGTDPIVAGSGQTTTFKITLVNPNAFEVSATVTGVLDTGLTSTEITTDTLGWLCPPAGSPSFMCSNIVIPPASPTSAPSTEVSMGANETVIINVKAKAEAWVTAKSLEMCAGTTTIMVTPAAPVGNPPTGCSTPVSPAGIGIYTEDAASVGITQVNDLVMTASKPGQIDPGEEVEVVYSITDNGPSLSFPLQVKFTLPDGLTFKSASGGWVCQTAGSEVTCTYQVDKPTRAKSTPSPIFLTMTFKTAAPGKVAKYVVPAQATTPGTDPTPDDAKTSTDIAVTPVWYDLTKTVSDGPYRVGDKVDWTLTVDNTGPIDDAGKITLMDTLPETLTFKKATGDGWTCSTAGQDVTCTHDGLPLGGTSTVTIRTKLTQRGSVENVATLDTVSYASASSSLKSSRKVSVFRTPQTAAPLPSSPRRILSGKTEQGRNLKTRVVCRPKNASSAGEVSFCKVKRSKGLVKVKVTGTKAFRVLVVQTAKGTAKYRPFAQKKVYTVRP